MPCSRSSTAALLAPLGGPHDARTRGEMTDKYRSRIWDAHAEQTDALIRLRLVAPADVVQAAEGLHQADHRVWESALGLTSESSDWQLLRDLQAEAREELLRIS